MNAPTKTIWVALESCVLWIILNPALSPKKCCSNLFATVCPFILRWIWAFWIWILPPIQNMHVVCCEAAGTKLQKYLDDQCGQRSAFLQSDTNITMTNFRILFSQAAIEEAEQQRQAWRFGKIWVQFIWKWHAVLIWLRLNFWSSKRILLRQPYWPCGAVYGKLPMLILLQQFSSRHSSTYSQPQCETSGQNMTRHSKTHVDQVEKDVERGKRLQAWNNLGDCTFAMRFANICGFAFGFSNCMPRLLQNHYGTLP